MMDKAPNVTQLKTAPKGIPINADDGGYLQSLIDFVEVNALFEYDPDATDVLELVPAKPDETRVGNLSVFETKCFTLFQLAKTTCDEILLEAEITTHERIAYHMRSSNMSHSEALAHVTKPESHPLYAFGQRAVLNQLGCVLSAARNAYDFSVRSRFNEFENELIVRKGFIAYSFTTQFNSPEV